jgi:hypothetical protein
MIGPSLPQRASGMKDPQSVLEVDLICYRLDRLKERAPERFEECIELVCGVVNLKWLSGGKHVDTQAQQWAFLKLQYVSLREEINQTKSRLFKLAIFGITVVPVIHFLSERYRWDSLTIAMPIWIIILTLLYLSESRSIMRCGKYIREMLEPEIKPFSKTWLPWEQWLESESTAREPDKYLYYCFQIIFYVYYTGSIYLSAYTAYTHYGTIALVPLLVCYLPVGIFFVLFMQKSIGSCTTTSSLKESQSHTGRESCFSSFRL